MDCTSPAEKAGDAARGAKIAIQSFLAEQTPAIIRV